MDKSTYILSPDELRKLQLVLLDMLIELDRICKKNKIRYALDGGTLLGAVRHKGFIPWDDDIDVVMLREDYDRFREVCLRDLNAEKYFYQDHTTDPYYRWGYARIRRKNSEFVRVGQAHMKMRTGIFLDIFPRDNVPDSPLIRPLHNVYCFFIRKILYSEVGQRTGKNAAQRFAYRLLYLIPRDFAFRLHDKLAERWNQKPARLVRTITFPVMGNNKYGYKRKWFENIADIEFEGHLFSGVEDYDGYLTCLYGDYMTLPPENKRHWHPVSKFCPPDDD